MVQHPAVVNSPPDGVSRILSISGINGRILLFAVLSLIALYFSSLYSYLFFHLLVEFFSVVIAYAIFMFAWNTREKTDNGALLLLGAAYLTVGSIDLLHAVTYPGMGVLPDVRAYEATQLWIAARYIESLSLAVAPLFAARRIAMSGAIVFYLGLLLLVITVILIWPVFPACFVEGSGLTPFKKTSEYIIAAILVLGLLNLRRRRRQFDPAVFQLLAIALLFSIAAEMMFTFYISVYGISNLIGHYFKLGSFWLIYKAIIETGLRQPYSLLFRQLANSEKRYRDLVANLPTGIVEFDADANITYINEAGLEITGYSHHDYSHGLTLAMLLDAEGREKAGERLKELARGHAVDSAEYQLTRKDGSRADIIVNSTPVYHGGQLIAIQTSLTDVTELHRLQDRLQQARKMEAIATLAGGMAHQINNALTAIVGNIDLIKLKAAAGDELAEADFDDLSHGCNRIAKLINYLLAYARGGRYQVEAIEMAKFMPEALAELEGQLNSGIRPGIRLSRDMAPGLPTIEADPMQLKLVVAAIINNAIEAIDTSGRIEIDLQAVTIADEQSRRMADIDPGRYLRLQVRDSGRGMDAETRRQIFEPFFSRKFVGRGLGMAAVYGIIKNHGGGIEVDSEPGRGTTVRIYLPVREGA